MAGGLVGSTGDDCDVGHRVAANASDVGHLLCRIHGREDSIQFQITRFRAAPSPLAFFAAINGFDFKAISTERLAKNGRGWSNYPELSSDTLGGSRFGGCQNLAR
jgi:hypothetical protein